MKQLILIVILLTGLIVFSVDAQGTGSISSFTSSVSQVGRTALVGRTARIPVSWTTENRSLISNLVFEQIMPDGGTVNVELPRLIPYVASNGDGIAAPILPSGDVTSITLRVSLVNTFSGLVYDTEEIVLAIVQGDTGSSGNTSNVLALTRFTASYAAPINRTELDNGTIRIPVSWTAINRPTWANLIFEQVLPDGTVVNVELPRPFRWVNSSDSGVVAPHSVGDANEIVLRVRLADISWDRSYDIRYAYIPVQSANNPPEITSFNATTDSISARDVANGTGYFDVSWSVNNRPNGTNLVFEQVLPDGRLRNAELPRDVLIVPSSGNGVVLAIMPDGDVTELQFRVRLVDLSNNNTLDSADIYVQLVDFDSGQTVQVTGDACYRSPFPENQGVAVGEEGRIQERDNGLAIPLYDDLAYSNVIANLNAGDTFTIEEGPYCSYYSSNNSNSSRRWRINFNGQTGWMQEYDPFTSDNLVYNFIPADQDDLARAVIHSFTVSPMTVSAGDVATTDFTLTWETENADYFSLPFVATNNIPVSEYDSGTYIISGSSIGDFTDEIIFTLYIHDAQNNVENVQAPVAVETSASINSFTVTPDSASGNEQVTFAWDISGDFNDAQIGWVVGVNSTYEVIHEITGNSGTYSFTLPDTLPEGERHFALTMNDNAGATLSENITVTYHCPYTWNFTITENDCPKTDLISRTGAYQAFQRGFIVWLPYDNDSMWVFYNNGTVERYQDNWNNQAYTIDRTAPDGLFAPERGFGYLWSSVPEVQSGLGWASADEQSYTVDYQETLSYGGYSGKRYYLQLPDSQVLRVHYTSALTPLNWETAD